MALHSTTVIARASGSEAELCLLPLIIDDDDDDDGVDVIHHYVALLSFIEILDIWSHFDADFADSNPLPS